jgi:coenzyme F420-reducing hydrogenase beta subunit
MNKVGLMTWFSHNNYGSVLQAFALKKIIESHGYNVEFINYEPKVRKKTLFDMKPSYYYNQILNKIYLKKYAKNFLNINDIYEEFRHKHFIISNKCEGYKDLVEVCNQYQFVVCGSDQIWSPNVFDINYFLPFLEPNKKIAYAPSIGVSNISNEFILNKIKKLVSDFKNISFREENAIELLSCNNAKWVLDPTLLLTKDEWINTLNLKKYHKKYILCYFLSDNKKFNKVANKLAKVTGLDIKYIPVNKNTLYKKNDIAWETGPKEFVELIYNASYVLTDSFHGALFSIIFNKEFNIFERFKNTNLESQNSRVYNILNKMNLNSRLISSFNQININNQINYTEVNDKLEKYRSDSLNYLLNSFSDEHSLHNPKKNISNVECTGCGLCTLICPKKCISIKLNDNGFYSSIIDESKCVNCGLCKKMCPQLNSNSVSLSKSKLYSGKSADDTIIKKSTSGGVAYEISKYALSNNIPVIGCYYNNNANIAEHIMINSINDLNKLSGSKYLQSYTVNAFEKISSLENGIIFGTPCQIAAIDIYLKKLNKRDKFVLVDLICHGVPSYNLWKKTIKNINVNKVNFRDKSEGWHKILLTINNRKISNKKFYNFFNYNLIYNECCYNCNYRSKSSADIRLGDYWHSKFSKNKLGINMIIINTSVGEHFIKKIKHIIISPENIDDYFLMQQSQNELVPLDYYDIINALKNDNASWSVLYKKYCRKRVYDRFIRKNGYKILKTINFHNK